MNIEHAKTRNYFYTIKLVKKFIKKGFYVNSLNYIISREIFLI